MALANNAIDEYLDTEIDDYVTCTTCDWTGFVRVGSETCPGCGVVGNLADTVEDTEGV